MRVLLCSMWVSGVIAGCGNVSASGPVDSASSSDDSSRPGDDSGSASHDAGIDGDLNGDVVVVTEAALSGGTVGARVGSIDIVSDLPSNAVLATARTDAGGSATVRVAPGGSVTAIYKHTVDVGADLITWVGVKPGDTLNFGSRKFAPSAAQDPSIGSQTYTWSALAGANKYRISTLCNLNFDVPAPDITVQLPEFSSCHQDPMISTQR